jgi:hypothetical protein
MTISDDDQINDYQKNALASLYAAERADLSTIGNQLLGVSTLALTYIVAVFAVLGHSNTKQMSLLWFAAPIPVFIFLAFYALFLSLSIARTASCEKLEGYLAADTPVEADKMGMSMSNRVMDITKAPLLYKGLLAAAYVPILLGSLGVIAYIVYQTFQHNAPGWLRAVSLIGYGLLLVPIALSWLGIGLIRKIIQ